MGGEQGQLHLTILGIDRPLDPQMIDEMRPQKAQKNHEQKQRFPARGLENLSGDQPQSKHRQILIMIVSSGKPHPLSAGCALVSKSGMAAPPAKSSVSPDFQKNCCRWKRRAPGLNSDSPAVFSNRRRQSLNLASRVWATTPGPFCVTQ